MSGLDKAQSALKDGDIFFEKICDMKFVECDANGKVLNDVDTNNTMSSAEENAVKDAAKQAGNGTGFYVKGNDNKWTNVSNLSGGQKFQTWMEKITKMAQNVATAITTIKSGNETVKRAYS